MIDGLLYYVSAPSTNHQLILEEITIILKHTGNNVSETKKSLGNVNFRDFFRGADRI